MFLNLLSLFQFVLKVLSRQKPQMLQLLLLETSLQVKILAMSQSPSPTKRTKYYQYYKCQILPILQMSNTTNKIIVDKNNKTYDIHKRIYDFIVRVIKLVNSLPKTSSN